MTGSLWCYVLAVICLMKGLFLWMPFASKWMRALPRDRVAGMVLIAVAWIWAGVVLALYPIDFLASVQGFLPYVCVGCIPLSWVLLPNLLMCRAWAGLMMLWPMPVIMACREALTAWRLVPISLGYVALTIGMVVMFYPWLLRDGCFALADRRWALRLVGAIAWCLAGALAIAGWAL